MSGIIVNVGEYFVEEEDRVQGTTENGCWKDRCFCFGTTCVLLNQNPKQFTALKIQELLRKIGLGASHSTPMELCAQGININCKDPNKNTDTGKPHVASAPGAWVMRRPLPSPLLSSCCFPRGTGPEDIHFQ